jgi:phosphonate transport system permease protein
VFVVVISIELLSSRIRARLRPSEHEHTSFVQRLRDLGDVDKWLGRVRTDSDR